MSLCSRRGLGLYALANDDQFILRTGNRSADEQQVALDIRADDFEVLMRRAFDTHVTGATRAFRNAAGIRGAVRPVVAVKHGAVARAAAREVVTLDTAGKAFAFGDADNVNAIAGFKRSNG